MKTKTGILVIYTPFGTTTAVCVELQYRGKTRHQVTGLRADRETHIATVRRWAGNAGFTHTRIFGDTVITKIERSK